MALSFQLLDLPGIIEGAKDGKGRGKQVITGQFIFIKKEMFDDVIGGVFYSNAVARTCNIIFLVLDVLKPLQHKRLIEHELEGFGIRLNKTPPNIYFKRKDKGGINFTATVRSSQNTT